MTTTTTTITELSSTNAVQPVPEGHTSTRQIMNGKPVLYIDRKSILKDNPAFEEKRLCDGHTFSCGDACAYNCTFCYVSLMFLLEKIIQALLKASGLKFAQAVIRRRNALKILRSQLLDKKGMPRYMREKDRGKVVYGSPLVDVAANLELTRETAAICRLFLEFTHWDIRLLSKSSLLPRIAEELGDFCGAKQRIIYGVSTGTLDNKLAAAFEKDTAKVSLRLKSLHQLQDAGFRTFGMICPSLPQEDYGAFAREMADAVRVDRCEHVWGEVINLRGESFSKTAEALNVAGFWDQVVNLASVCGPGSRAAWEEYARATFEAHASVIPPEKLRYLQYVTPNTIVWWRAQESRGAVLLGKLAHEQAAVVRS